MKLNHTRSNGKKVNLSYALVNPSSDFGGLFAPSFLPKISKNFLKKAKYFNYEKLAFEIIKLFRFNINNKIIKKSLKSYSKFDFKNPAVVKKIDKNLYINELFWGPSKAFKDMALCPFAEILSQMAIKQKQKYLIICATSGDTGPATLSAFGGKKNIKVVCIYPKNGTSKVQELQMLSAKFSNLNVIGINSDFDDAQKIIKNLLNNDIFKNELENKFYKLSAANSVNFGRILFQIIYHIYACLKFSYPVNIIVPSGNFGNALAAYYAKKMGLNINKIKIVSNSNNVLSDFFKNGIYDLRDRKLQKTISPAMDILLSSNLERLIFDKFGYKRCKELYDNLTKNKFFKLNQGELNEIQRDFEGDFCSDEECLFYIKKYQKMSVDPHTATCFKMIDNEPCLITATAHWAKFAPSMAKALDLNLYDEKEQLEYLQNYLSPIPDTIKSLFDSKIFHNKILDNKEIPIEILNWINDL